MKIIAISGSLRKGSLNTALARNLQALAPAGMEITLGEIRDIPPFNQDDEHDAYPAAAKALKDQVAAADGVIFVTPEYNRSIPGVLKNAIDWVSRPYGTSAWRGKPALVMGVTGGSIGTALAQAALHNVLLYLDMHLMGQPELYIGSSAEHFDATGALVDPKTKELISSALAVLATKK